MGGEAYGGVRFLSRQRCGVAAGAAAGAGKNRRRRRGAAAVLCVQRQLTALDDTLIEPQDIPLPAVWDCWETEHLLLLAGTYLLLGRL